MAKEEIERKIKGMECVYIIWCPWAVQCFVLMQSSRLHQPLLHRWISLLFIVEHCVKA